MLDPKSELAGAKTVVFGGCGFLGSQIAYALVEAGAETLVYDSAPFHAGVPVEARYMQADALDASSIRWALEGADRVFSFTGSGGAPASLKDPASDFAASCETQLVLLDAVRAVCPEATVVFPGSRLEYGRPQSLPVAETHPLAGDSPYAVNKSACAAYYRIYAQVHGLRTIVLRLSNPYGAHPVLEKYKGFGILNHFIDQALLDRPIQLYGEGSQLRDFVYVEDVVEAVIAASSRPDLAGSVMNIGAGEGVSLAEAASEVIDLVGRGSIEHVPWPEEVSQLESGDFYFDVSLAKKLLDWQPSTTLRAGLEKTLAAEHTPQEGSD